jgi:trimeric autotransporter adhesin
LHAHAQSPVVATVFNQYAISTVAGGAPPATPVAATSASIGGPWGVATDAAGNVYFTGLGCVFKIDTSGVLTRIAGTSRLDYSGDGGPAISAPLSGPTSASPGQYLTVDGAGNVYIADLSRVRRVAPNGIITTVAGGGTSYPGNGGPALSASLGGALGLTGIATDASGNIFVASSGNLVQEVSPSGIITTVAGNGTYSWSGDGGPATSAEIGGSQGVALDSAGNLYIVDLVSVRKVSPQGIITTVAGNGTNVGFSGDGGPAIDASLYFPQGIALDGAGNLYIADSGNNRVRMVTPAGIITTVAGGFQGGFSGDGGPATSAELNDPVGVALDSAGNLYIADYGNNRIRKVSPQGIITTAAGNGVYSFSGDGGPATSAQLAVPQEVAVDSSGIVYVADAANDRVRRISPGGVISTVAGNGSQGFAGDGGPATQAELNAPQGVAADSAGNVYIADGFNDRIRKVSPQGIITTVAGNGTQGFSGDGGPATSAQLSGPLGVAVDSSNNLYIADTYNNRVRKVDSSGTITTIAGYGTSPGYTGDGGPATNAELNGPSGVAVDGSGDVFILDGGYRYVREVSAASGMINTVLPPGVTQNQLSGSSPPCDPGIAADRQGDLFVQGLVQGFAVVLEVTPKGAVLEVAGALRPCCSYSGDGGPANTAGLSCSDSYLLGGEGLAVDALGNVYIADTGNNAVRVLQPVNSRCSLARWLMPRAKWRVPSRRGRSSRFTALVSGLPTSRSSRSAMVRFQHSSPAPRLVQRSQWADCVHIEYASCANRSLRGHRIQRPGSGVVSRAIFARVHGPGCRLRAEPVQPE